MTGQTDQHAAVIAQLAGPRLSFPRLAEVVGDHESGDLAYETRVGGVGGDGATHWTGPFACVKTEATQEQTKRNLPGDEHTLFWEGSCESLNPLGNICERLTTQQERKGGDCPDCYFQEAT